MAGVNLETIRYYERQRVLPEAPRTNSGYRVFSDEAVERLRFVKRAQELGFSLKEIKELLALKVKPGVSCADIRAKAQAKIVDVDEKSAIYKRSGTCSPTWQLGARGGPLSGCSILQALNDRESE